MSQILETDPETGGVLIHDVGNKLSMDTHFMLALKNAASSINLAVNGSVTPAHFFIQPPVDKIYTLKRMNVRVVAATFANALRYGGLGTGDGISAGLPVGLSVFVENGDGAIGSGTLLVDYTADRKIKVTSDWGLLAGVDAMNEDGTFDDPFLVRWTFSKSCGHIILNGSTKDRLVVSVADDLTGLTSQINMVSGSQKQIN